MALKRRYVNSLTDIVKHDAADNAYGGAEFTLKLRRTPAGRSNYRSVVAAANNVTIATTRLPGTVWHSKTKVEVVGRWADLRAYAAAVCDILGQP